MSDISYPLLFYYSNPNFNQKLMNLNCGVIKTHFKNICIPVFTTLKMSTLVGETFW